MDLEDLSVSDSVGADVSEAYLGTDLSGNSDISADSIDNGVSADSIDEISADDSKDLSNNSLSESENKKCDYPNCNQIIELPYENGKISNKPLSGSDDTKWEYVKQN